PTTHVISEAGPAAFAAYSAPSSQPEPITPPRPIAVSCQNPKSRLNPNTTQPSRLVPFPTSSERSPATTRQGSTSLRNLDLGSVGAGRRSRPPRAPQDGARRRR